MLIIKSKIDGLGFNEDNDRQLPTRASIIVTPGYLLLSIYYLARASLFPKMSSYDF